MHPGPQMCISNLPACLSSTHQPKPRDDPSLRLADCETSAAASVCMRATSVVDHLLCVRGLVAKQCSTAARRMRTSDVRSAVLVRELLRGQRPADDWGRGLMITCLLHIYLMQGWITHVLSRYTRTYTQTLMTLSLPLSFAPSMTTRVSEGSKDNDGGSERHLTLKSAQGIRQVSQKMPFHLPCFRIPGPRLIDLAFPRPTLACL
ncbi:hypothetical protein QBC39DRAFT_145200 [Podospora conica]|nr:hypothetical protein QBC39DRAFT_145200 [Schizothecium conicum]